ncbi:MAG: hypothetical protein CM1200mP12_16340 [Gammaproteobacteria bacterium]|nr:MAG: hypothetical protein CM1200mP12_16340 [Gammaproteobacteria bacterium]
MIFVTDVARINNSGISIPTKSGNNFIELVNLFGLYIFSGKAVCLKIFNSVTYDFFKLSFIMAKETLG